MEVWIVVGNTGNEWVPDVSIWGVYKDKSIAEANKYELELEYEEDAKFWVEGWEVE